jgi:uncharacterized protein HemX
MERSSIALVAAAALALSTTAFAQSRTERAPPSLGQTQELKVSDADLAKFADIYVDLQETATKFEAELAGAKSDEEAQAVQSKMQQESVAKVAQHGWTPERYVSVGEAINSSPDLAEKTLALIDERI